MTRIHTPTDAVPQRRHFIPRQMCSRRWTRANAAGGFTMLELLITMLLLTIVLTGLAALQVAAIRNVSGSRRSAEAMRLGQSTLERYKAMSWVDVQAHTPGSFLIESDKNGVQMSNVAVDGVSKGPYTVAVMTEVLGTGAVLITAKVTWMDVSSKRDGAGTLTYEEFNVVLSTLRFG